MAGELRYTEEEAKDVLRLALDRTHATGEVSQERLAAMAADLGISPEDLLAAQRSYEVTRREERDHREYVAENRPGFIAHLIPFVSVNIFLAVLNVSLVLSGRMGKPVPFALFCLMGWGIGMYFHWESLYKRNSGSYRQAFDAWRKRRSGHTPMDDIVNTVSRLRKALTEDAPPVENRR